MRIGIILPTLLGGGTERSTLRLAGGLLERGHQVDLILLHPLGRYRKAIPSGIRLYHTMRPSRLRKASGGLSLLAGETCHGLAFERLSVSWWRKRRAFQLLCRRFRFPEAASFRITSRWAAYGDSVARILKWQHAHCEIHRRWPEIKSLTNISSLATNSAAVATYLQKNQPDVVFSALPSANAVAVCCKALGAETPIVVSLRNNLAFHPGDLLARARILYREADAIVAVSKGAADGAAGILELDPQRIAAVPNPVPVAAIAAEASEPVEHPWFAEGEAPVVLTVGRPVPQKDHPTLIRAFALLRRSMEARLAILCDVDQHEQSTFRETKELAASLGVAEDVAYLDFDENPFRYMSRAAVLALSSLHEGFPNVLVEAMACGTPVASTDAPYGPDEILEGGQWGPLVPVGDADALAGALAGILAGQRVSANNLRARAAVFSTEKVVDEYEALFTALLP